MIPTIIGIVASVLATWIVAHIYYRRGTKDLQRIIDHQQAILEKLPASLATKLAHEQVRFMHTDQVSDPVRRASERISFSLPL